MDKNNEWIVTIDGPSGAGKSTVSRELAKRLDYVYLDTGAIYRAVAYQAVKSGISLDDEQSMNEFLNHLKIKLKQIDHQMHISIDETDVTDHIRTEEIGLAASKISAFPMIRSSLLEVQREMGKRGSIVAEGRDMGTVVFPHANIKFFLDADPRERIKRRHKELLDKGMNFDLQTIEKDLHLRDKQDRERAVAPLKIPEGAIIIDSSKLSVMDVIEKMMNFVNKYNNLKSW